MLQKVASLGFMSSITRRPAYCHLHIVPRRFHCSSFLYHFPKCTPIHVLSPSTVSINPSPNLTPPVSISTAANLSTNISPLWGSSHVSLEPYLLVILSPWIVLWLYFTYQLISCNKFVYITFIFMSLGYLNQDDRFFHFCSFVCKFHDTILCSS